MPRPAPATDPPPVVHRSVFVRELRQRIPEVEAELAGNRFTFLEEMSSFMRFTQSAIDRGDLPLVARCFRFADDIWPRANRAVLNFLYVVYLEHLEFTGTSGEAAFRLLSPRLREAHRAIHEYLRELDEIGRKLHGQSADEDDCPARKRKAKPRNPSREPRRLPPGRRRR